MEDNNYLETLRLNLIDAYGTDNVPDSATFVSKMSDSKYREDVHFNLVDAYGTDNVPDIKTFNLKIGTVEKKNLVGNDLSTGGKVGVSETPSIGNEVAGLLGVKPIKPSQYAVPSPLVEETRNVKLSGTPKGNIDLKGETKLSPENEIKFLAFQKTMPENLRKDNDLYNSRGYWESLGMPKVFDNAQQKNNDGTIHAYSRNPKTGEILKSQKHPTFLKAIQEDEKIGYFAYESPDGKIYTLSKKDNIPSEFKRVSFRPDGTKKDVGYFGELKTKSGNSVTEYSFGTSDVNGKEMNIPSLVPTLTPQEKQYVLDRAEKDEPLGRDAIGNSIYQKAVDHARKRIKEGKSPFYSSEELDKSTFDNYNKTFEDYKQKNKELGNIIKTEVSRNYVISGGVLSDLVDISSAYFSNPNYKEDNYFTNSAYKKAEEEYKKTPSYAFYTKIIQKSKNAFFEAKAKADKETERQSEVIAKSLGGWGSLVAEGGKADVDKIREGVDSFLEKNKIESDSPIAYKLRNELKAQAEFKYIEPKINEEFEAQYQKLYGTTPEEDIKKEYGVTVEKAKGIKAAKQELEKKRLLEDKALEAEFKPEYESLGSSYKAKTTEIDSQIENDSELNSFAQQLGQERQSRYQAMVDNGQMSVEQANAEMNSPASIEEEKKKILQKINEKYGKVYESAFAEYQKSLNEVGSRYKSAYRQQENARVDQANKKIELEIESLKEQFQISPALIEKRKKAYEDAYTKVSDSGLKAEIAAGRTLPFLAQSGMSLLMGLGGGLKGVGAEFDNKFLYDLGESLESDFKINVGESKEFSDWLDSSKLTVGTGNIIGRMLPGIGLTAAAAALTKDWNLTLRLATTATTGFTAESSDMAGTIRDEVLQRTGDPAKADDAARDMWRSQLYLFPLYGLEGEPFISEFFTTFGKKIAPKIFAETAKGARKTIGQWAKETAVKASLAGGGQLTIENIQEFLQNINEEAIRNGKEIKSIADQIDVYREGATLPKLKETIVMVSPSTLIMGATPVFVSSAYNKAKSSYYERSVDNYLNSASISTSLETSPEQYLFNINREKGKNFTGTLLNTLFTSGKISESEFDRLSEKMVNMEAYNEVVKKAKVKGNEIANLVGYRLYDQYISATQAYESEKDEFAKEVLKKQADEAKAQFVNLLQGKGANVSVMTLSNGQQYAFLPDEMMFALQFPNIRESIKNGDIGVVVGGDKAVVGDLLKELESLEQEPQATQQPSQPIITKNTTPTDEKYGTIDRGDGKGVIDLTRAEYEAEVEEISEIRNEKEYLEKEILSEEEFINKTKNNRTFFRKILDKIGGVSYDKYLKNAKEKLALLEKNPLAYFENELNSEIEWGKKNPDDINEGLIESYKGAIEKLKNQQQKQPTVQEVAVEETSAFETEPTTEAAPSVEPSQEERKQSEAPTGNYEIAQENDVESTAKALEDLEEKYGKRFKDEETYHLIQGANGKYYIKHEDRGKEIKTYNFENEEQAKKFAEKEGIELLTVAKNGVGFTAENKSKYDKAVESLLSKEQTPSALSGVESTDKALEIDSKGNFVPKKYTLNRKGENTAPNITISAIDKESSALEDLEDVKQVKLLEIRGKNSQGQTVGTVWIQKNDGQSYSAEVIFNDAELKSESLLSKEQTPPALSGEQVKNKLQEIEKQPVKINITQDANGKMEQTSQEVIDNIKEELDKTGLPYSDVVSNDKGSTYFVVTKDGQQHEILKVLQSGGKLVPTNLTKAKWINHLIKTERNDVVKAVEQLLTPNTNQNEQKSSNVESEKGGNESLRNESPLNEGVQQGEGRQEENVTEQGGVTAPSPKTQQNETKTEQEKPLLEGVRNGGNETQGGQESTELRAETQVQEEVKATIADAVAKFYAIEGKGSQKREAAKAYRQTLEKMPTVKNIFDNIKPIFAQLEREGIITKSKECP